MLSALAAAAVYSDGGLQFEVIFFFSALSQMFVDQGFWQSAIAADGVESVKVRAVVRQLLRSHVLRAVVPRAELHAACTSDKPAYRTPVP